MRNLRLALSGEHGVEEVRMIQIGIAKRRLRRLIRFQILIIAIVTTGILSGCGPVNLRLYPGPKRLKEQITVVTNKPSKNRIGLHLEAVDEDRLLRKRGIFSNYVDTPTELKLELQPGIHLITVRYCYYSYDSYSVRGENELAVEFDAKAGHTYNIDGETWGHSSSGGYWRPVVTDISSEEPVKARILGAQATALFDSINKLFNNANYVEALIQCEQAIELYPYDPYPWMLKGLILGRQGHFERAVESHNRCLELAPGFHRATINKGYDLLRLERSQEAISCAERALKHNAHRWDAWFIIGLALIKTGSHIEAAESFQHAIDISPDDSYAWLYKGKSLIDQGKTAEGIESVDKAIELAPENASILQQACVLFRETGMLDESLRCCNRAIELDPKFASAWISKGRVLRKLDRFEQALEACEQALAISPRYHVAWYDKGLILHHLGRNNEAIEAFERAASLGNDNAREELKALRGGDSN